MRKALNLLIVGLCAPVCIQKPRALGGERRAKKPLQEAACRLWQKLFFPSPANYKAQTGQTNTKEEEGGGFGNGGGSTNVINVEK